MLEAAGASITLPEKLWSAAAAEQEKRREVDDWEDVLRDVLGTLMENDRGRMERRIFSQELVDVNLGITNERKNTVTSKRLADCMRIIGWDGPKPMRIGDDNRRGFSQACWQGGVDGKGHPVIESLRQEVQCYVDRMEYDFDKCEGTLHTTGYSDLPSCVTLFLKFDPAVRVHPHGRGGQT